MRQLAGAQSDGLKELLRRKVLHGAHYKTVQNATTDRKSTNKWLVEGKLKLVEGKLKSETEALVVAMQDGVIKTKHIKGKCRPNMQALWRGE